MSNKRVKEIAGGQLVEDGSAVTFQIIREGGSIVTLEFPLPVLLRAAQQIGGAAAEAQRRHRGATGQTVITVQRTRGFEVRSSPPDLVLTFLREDGFQDSFAIPMTAVPQLQADIASPPARRVN